MSNKSNSGEENNIIEQLYYIADKSLFQDGEPELITLYRYLGLKYRSENPVSKEHYDLNVDLKNLLERAICDSGVRYFADEEEH